MEPTEPKAEYEELQGKAASKAQIRRALKDLTSDDHIKLGLIAKYLVNKYRLHEAEMRPSDLINEAILRTMDGRRHWPIETVNFMYYLDRTMASLARHEYDELSKLTTLDSEYPATVPDDPDDDGETSAKRAKVAEAFAMDPEALEFLLLRNDGKSVAEAAEAMGKSNTEIDAIKRRAHRRIEKLSGSVGKHGQQKAPNGQ
jgi:DNA-directed RNA polymerase specialized sigma24 family protein